MERTVLIAAPAQSPSWVEDLADLARDSGARVLLIPDLYDLPEGSPVWDALRAATGPLVVFSSLHPRPAEWVLHRQGVDTSQIECHRSDPGADAARLWAQVSWAIEAGGAAGSVEDLRGSATPRWYPVLDRSRCENCHHCVQFCLFGVWAKDDRGQAWVRSPDACKDGCPACARICPHGAIMFPRHEDDPAIAGAPGAVLTPDPEARKMYYVRTQKPCPVCGLVGEAGLRARQGAVRCPECGRFPGVKQFPGKVSEPSVVRDEIDALIGALEDVLGGDPT